MLDLLQVVCGNRMTLVHPVNNTNQLAQVIGCTDLAFDPVNPDVMYLATGDGDAGDTYTVGLLKSTDAGATWNPTGLLSSLQVTAK